MSPKSVGLAWSDTVEKNRLLWAKERFFFNVKSLVKSAISITLVFSLFFLGIGKLFFQFGTFSVWYFFGAALL